MNLENQDTLLKKLRTNLTLLTLSIIFTLIVCEVIVRLLFPYSVFKDGFFIWPANLTRIFHPYENVMIGITGESIFQTNSIGLRGDELLPTHTNRILTIGGSTTECLYLDQEETWPKLLQTKLNDSKHSGKVWVGNGGMSGRTTRNHLTAVRYLDLDELDIDLIIMLVGINDFARRLAQDNDYDPDFLKTEGATEFLLKNTFTGTDFERKTGMLLDHSSLWWIINVFWRGQNEEATIQDSAGKIYEKWREN